jgi:hypothetical protein
MEGLDELLSFPSGFEQMGGTIDDSFNIFTRDDIKTKSDDKTVDIHTTPIIMTEKMPSGGKTVGDISSFIGTTGLANTDILALNGEAVRKILTNPNDNGKGINEHLFLLTTGQRYQNVSDLVERQVAFLCIFHHLFFLGKLAKYPNFPMFTDSFSDKFNAVQAQLQEVNKIVIGANRPSTVAGENANIKTTAQLDDVSTTFGSQGEPTSTEVFGVPSQDLIKFWTELTNGISFESNITLSDMIEVLKKSPKEIYPWFTNSITEPPAAAPTPAAAPAAGTTEVPTPTGAAAGVAMAPAVGTTPAPESVASTVSTAPEKIVESGTTLPAAEEHIQAMFRASGRAHAAPPPPPTPPQPQQSAAEKIAAATGRPTRRAAESAKRLSAAVAADEHPRITAAAAAVETPINANNKPTAEELKAANAAESAEANKKAKLSAAAANDQTSTNGIPNEEQKV